MVSSISDLFRQNNPYEKFVEQLVALESRTKLQLQARQSEEKSKKSALGQVRSVITRFESKIDEVEENGVSYFQPYRLNSSNNNSVELVSADGIDQPSSYNIDIERVARNDTLLSATYTADDDSLASHGDGSFTLTIGDKSETVNVEVTYEDEDGITVTKTNQEILESLADQINTLFADEAQASVFNLDGENIQLSVQSRETGYDDRIQISNETGVLNEISSETDHLVPQNELNAKFTIDGVTFERSENLIEDAISGLTFELKQPTENSEQLSVSRNLNRAVRNIEDFISSYNRLNSTIRGQTFIDADEEGGETGRLQSIRSIRNLTYMLRLTGIQEMEGAGEGELRRLSEIGITFGNDGTMSIDDRELLEEALEQKSGEVAELFTHETSPIQQMKSELLIYTDSSSGLISSIEDGIDQTIDRLDRRIEAQERYLEQYEQQQRDTFNELQLIIEQGQSQFDQVLNFRQRIGF